ncbi:MAG: rubrerythrin family protein [Clostridiales Family XIII bacterium]|jgi:rubrerythrin|nr:rubrerythrin family protein [Clostridiales Family XIII bacterium]
MATDPKLKGTRTEANLMEAFAGESQARNKYTFYSSQAAKDGFRQISNIFAETAGNEKEHAELWFKRFHGIGTTSENLADAAAGEHFEWTEMYARMAKEAKEEGFDDIALQFENVGKVEKEHEERYLKLKDNIDTGKVFERSEPVLWRCGNCGFTYTGAKAVAECPACKHPQAYFEIAAENY